MRNDQSSTVLHHALPVAGQPHNRYCGPAALAAVIGISTGQAAKEIRRVSGLRSVTGTAESEMVQVLRNHGFHAYHEPVARTTLKRWINKQHDGNTVIVIAGNHYWAISGDKYVDSFNRLPTPLDQIRQPRCIVESEILIDAA